MKTLSWLGVLAAGMTLSGCEGYGPPPPPPGAVVGYAAPAAAVAPACFRTNDIRNHTLGDERTLFLNVNGRAVYRVETDGSCFAGATSSDPILIRNPPGSNIVCRPIDLDLSITMSGGFTNRCIVRSVTPMSLQEVAALPPRVRP